MIFQVVSSLFLYAAISYSGRKKTLPFSASFLESPKDLLEIFHGDDLKEYEANRITDDPDGNRYA